MQYLVSPGMILIALLVHDFSILLETCWHGQDLAYHETDGDEVEDLYTLLAYVQGCIPTVNAVSSGAIASNYQRLRVENVSPPPCARHAHFAEIQRGAL